MTATVLLQATIHLHQQNDKATSYIQRKCLVLAKDAMSSPVITEVPKITQKILKNTETSRIKCYTGLQRVARWMVRGVYTQYFGFKPHPFKDARYIILYIYINNLTSCLVGNYSICFCTCDRLHERLRNCIESQRISKCDPADLQKWNLWAKSWGCQWSLHQFEYPKMLDFLQLHGYCVAMELCFVPYNIARISWTTIHTQDL